MVLECPEIESFTALDAWLKSALGIDHEPCICLIPRNAMNSQAGRTADLAWRCLLATRSLLNASGIPVFDPGAVVRMEPNPQMPSQWLVTAGLAHIDEIVETCYTLALQSAVSMVRFRLQAADVPPDSKQLFSEVEKQAILPIKRMVISGKSTIPLLRAAYDLDIPFLHLGAGVYQLGWGSRARRIDRSTTESDALLGAKLAQSKVWSARLLRAAGLPSPTHGVAVSEKEALDLAHLLGWPVVVKPADADRGEGVATGIDCDDALTAAFQAAMQTSKIQQVLVERQVSGVCHRILVANDRVLYAAKLLPTQVVGDGRQTLMQLILSANRIRQIKAPWLRSEPFPHDALAEKTMRHSGFIFETVPEAGVTIPLRPVQSTRWGGEDEDVTSCMHPGNHAIALRAAALFNLNVAGIDIISPDLSKPWYENGAVINEINFAPTLGDGPVSSKYIPVFFQDFIDGDGRIPIEVFIGGDEAMAAAKRRQSERMQTGIRCFLTGQTLTMDGTGSEFPLTFQSLFQRCRALLMNRHVEALVVVVQTDEWLYTGLPVDRFECVITSSQSLTSWKFPDQAVPPERVRELAAAVCERASNRRPFA